MWKIFPLHGDLPLKNRIASPSTACRLLRLALGQTEGPNAEYGHFIAAVQHDSPCLKIKCLPFGTLARRLFILRGIFSILLFLLCGILLSLCSVIICPRRRFLRTSFRFICLAVLLRPICQAFRLFFRPAVICPPTGAHRKTKGQSEHNCKNSFQYHVPPLFYSREH